MRCVKPTWVHVGLLAGLLGGTAAPALGQTTLRYQFKEGQKIAYQLESKSETSMRVMDKEIATKATQSQDLAWHVGAVTADGKAKIKMRFGRFRITIDGPGVKKDIDSTDTKEVDDPSQKSMRNLFKAMSEADFTLNISTMGEMTDMAVPENFLKALKEAPGSEVLGDLFSGEGFKRMLSQGGLVVPREAVTKGKTWEQKSDVKLPLGQLKIKMVYTYEGPTTRNGRKVEQINFAPSITLESDPNAPIKIELKSQDGKGVAFFDNTVGRLVDLTLTQTMQMEISVMGQTVQQNIKQTSSMKLLDK